jgi:4-hydroxy-3-polyprenylbenzoate decarboxylase
MPEPPPKRIVVAMTGASGVIYGVRLLEFLNKAADIETHLIVTSGAKATLAYESSLSYSQIAGLADVVYNEGDVAAAISSGSFLTAGMVVAPCSMKTLGGIANAYDDNLVVRAADVTLKERRRLVLLVRETPLHATHLRMMMDVTNSGAIVAPPVPAFYHRPVTIDDLVNQTIGRVLDLFEIESPLVQRWTGSLDAARRARTDRLR